MEQAMRKQNLLDTEGEWEDLGEDLRGRSTGLQGSGFGEVAAS